MRQVTLSNGDADQIALSVIVCSACGEPLCDHDDQFVEILMGTQWLLDRVGDA